MNRKGSQREREEKTMTYIVERMTSDNYNHMMAGGYPMGCAPTETLRIEAESPEEAKAKAEKVGYVVNDYVTTEEEEKRKKEEWRKEREAWKKEEEERKKAKAEKEKLKAESLGLTVEEMRRRQRKRANLTRVRREIKKLEEELARKKVYLARLEREEEN